MPFGIGGFVGDILDVPVNILTGGQASAASAAKGPQKEALAQAQKTAGLAAGGMTPFATAGIQGLAQLAATTGQKAPAPTLANFATQSQIESIFGDQTDEFLASSPAEQLKQLEAKQDNGLAQQLLEQFKPAVQRYDVYDKAYSDWQASGKPGTPPVYQPTGAFQPSPVAALPRAPTFAQINPDAGNLAAYRTGAAPTFGGQIQNLNQLAAQAATGQPAFAPQTGQIPATYATENPMAGVQGPAMTRVTGAGEGIPASANLQTLEAATPYGAGGGLERLGAGPTLQRMGGAPQPLSAELGRVQPGQVPTYGQIKLGGLDMSKEFTQGETYQAMKNTIVDEVTREAAARGKNLSSSTIQTIANRVLNEAALPLLQNQQSREVQTAQFNQGAQLSEAQFNQLAQDKGFQSFMQGLGFNNTAQMLQQGFNADQIQRAFTNELQTVQANNAASQAEFGMSATAQQGNNAAIQNEINNQFRGQSQTFQDSLAQASYNMGVDQQTFLNALAGGDRRFQQVLQQTAANNGMNQQEFQNSVSTLQQGYQNTMQNLAYNQGVDVNRVQQQFQNTTANNLNAQQGYQNFMGAIGTQAGLQGQTAGLQGQAQGLGLQTAAQNANLANLGYQNFLTGTGFNNAAQQAGFQNLMDISQQQLGRELTGYQTGQAERQFQYGTQAQTAAQQQQLMSQLLGLGQASAAQQGSFLTGGAAMGIPISQNLSQANAYGAAAPWAGIQNLGTMALAAYSGGLLGGAPAAQQAAYTDYLTSLTKR